MHIRAVENTSTLMVWTREAWTSTDYFRFTPLNRLRHSNATGSKHYTIIIFLSLGNVRKIVAREYLKCVTNLSQEEMRVEDKYIWARRMELLLMLLLMRECVFECFRAKRMQSALAVCWVQGWAERLKERLLSSWDWSEDVVSGGAAWSHTF